VCPELNDNKYILIKALKKLNIFFGKGARTGDLRSEEDVRRKGLKPLN
jgi:hypothetical protein